MDEFLTVGEEYAVKVPDWARRCDVRYVTLQSMDRGQLVFVPGHEVPGMPDGLVIARAEPAKPTIENMPEQPRAARLSNILSELEQLEAVETLEHHDKNWLATNEGTRSRQKIDVLGTLIEQVMELIAEEERKR